MWGAQALLERRWFVLERPRRDTNGGSETEVTVTSKLQANAERHEEIEKRQKRGVLLMISGLTSRLEKNGCVITGGTAVLLPVR